MLTNVNSYHDGVLANYSHENIKDTRKMWLYSIASSNLFETDFQSLFGYYTRKYLEVGLLTCTASFILHELHSFLNLNFCFEIWLGCWFQMERSISCTWTSFLSFLFCLCVLFQYFFPSIAYLDTSISSTWTSEMMPFYAFVSYSWYQFWEDCLPQEW